MSPQHLQQLEQEQDARPPQNQKATPPAWFNRVIWQIVTITGIPAAIAILTVWSKLAVIEVQIGDIRESLKGASELKTEIAAMRAQQDALENRLLRIEGRLDRSDGGGGRP